MRIATLSLLTILCLALSAPAFADLYNNGPTNGAVNAWFIGSGPSYVVTDSFSVSSSETMNSFEFAQWVEAGSTPTTVDWAIGTTSFGGDMARGSSAITYNLICSAGPNCGLSAYDVYSSTVATGAIRLFRWQYLWLRFLANANDSFGGPLSVGHRLRPMRPTRDLLGAVPSESFTICNGNDACQGTTTTTTGTTPEPGDYALRFWHPWIGGHSAPQTGLIESSLTVGDHNPRGPGDDAAGFNVRTRMRALSPCNMAVVHQS